MVRWLRIVGGSLAGAVVLMALTAAATLYPYVRDDVVLDRVVRSVALDWRDFDTETARTRLQYELDRRQIGLHVGDEDCALTEDADGHRAVRCAWTVELAVPLSEQRLPLAFSSEARLTPDGRLQ